MSRKNNYQK